MKTIMVDMDDVITGGSFLKLVEDYLGYSIKEEDLKDYYIQDILGNKKKDFFDKFKDIDLYEFALMENNCYRVLKELSKYYIIYICTDYIWREIPEYAGNNLKNKYNYLYQKLEFINPRNFIFTSDKSIINCDIKIDDKLINLANSKVKLLYTAYHNKNYSNEVLKEKNVIRVNSWNEIGDLLLKDKTKI